MAGAVSYDLQRLGYWFPHEASVRALYSFGMGILGPNSNFRYQKRLRSTPALKWEKGRGAYAMIKRALHRPIVGQRCYCWRQCAYHITYLDEKVKRNLCDLTSSSLSRSDGEVARA